MFHIGDRVVYGIHGVCHIVELQIQKVNFKKVEYYVLEPLRQPGARFFVPSQNQAAVSKLRPILTRDEINQLLLAMQLDEDVWIENEILRKQQYREQIAACDRGALLRMIRTLYKHKQQQLQMGKKFHVSDANFLKDAEKMIYSEFSVVLDIPYEKIASYIGLFPVCE